MFQIFQIWCVLKGVFSTQTAFVWGSLVYDSLWALFPLGGALDPSLLFNALISASPPSLKGRSAVFLLTRVEFVSTFQ